MAARSFNGPLKSPAPLIAALGLAFSHPAAGIGLGDIQTQSYLGEPLEATVTVFASPGETISAECFSLVHAGSDGLPAVSQARFTFEPDATPPRVRVRTTAPQNEPVLQLRLKASCPGGGGFSRDYAILLDPVPVIVPPAVASSAPATTAAVASPAATATTAGAPSAAAPGLRAISGDSLASIATAIYPRNRGARDAYIEALRARNSGVAGLGPNDPIPEGTLLALPDLREFANTLGARPRAVLVQTTPPAPAGPPRKAAPPAAPREESAQPSKVETAPRKSEPAPAKVAQPGKKPEAAPVPKAAPAPKTAPKAEPPAAKAEPPAARAQAPSPKAEAPKAEAPKPPSKAQPPADKAAAKGGAGGDFVLRLSSPELDLSRSSAMDEKMRAQMRERLLLLDSDDQISALLSMRNNLRALENQVAQLQQRLVAADAAGGSASGTGTSGAPGAQSGAGSGAATGSSAPSPGAGALPASARPTPRVEPGFVESIPVWVWGLISVIAAAVAAFVGSVVAMKRMAAVRGGEAGGPPPGRSRAPQGAGTPAGAAGAAATLQGIAQRFPELADGSVDMDDPESVVGAAQRLYKQGSLQRAIDLLQFAVAERPAEIKPWLALFELFHLEAYPHEFGELAARFKRQHGDNESWRKVQEIGRDLDPANPLYAA